MSRRTMIALRAAAARWKCWLANGLLGDAARAARIVADADARIVAPDAWRAPLVAMPVRHRA